jgi:hypothetical protein
MDELAPVDPSEFVYRRIPRIHFQPGLPVLFRLMAFRPSARDTTGLSVVRAAFAQPADTLRNLEPAKQKEYYVVRLAVQDLLGLGLTVVAEPDPNGPAGHAIIPELSWQAHHADKQRLKTVQTELAKLASAAIVHTPR